MVTIHLQIHDLPVTAESKGVGVSVNIHTYVTIVEGIAGLHAGNTSGWSVESNPSVRGLITCDLTHPIPSTNFQYCIM